MTARLKTAGRLALVAALALLLTGCLKLDMDLQIQTDDTVDGSIVFAVNKDVLELTGGSFDDLLGDQTPFPSDVEGVTSEPYEDDQFSGQRFNFDGVPISQFADTGDPESLSIVRDGDRFVVTGVLDLSQGATGATGLGGLGGEQLFQSAEIRVAITFPGEVIESNGQVDGNTVTWEPEFGERQEISATGSAVEGGGGSSSWLTILLIALGAVVVVAIILVVVMLNRRKAAPPVEAAEPEAGMSAPPAAPAAPAVTAAEVSGTEPTVPAPASPTPAAVPEPPSPPTEPEVPPAAPPAMPMEPAPADESTMPQPTPPTEPTTTEPTEAPSEMPSEAPAEAPDTEETPPPPPPPPGS